MRKIIFMDVDGVLNNQGTFKKVQRVSDMLDPYLVLLMNRIVEATGAEVVLSSSWRHMYYEELKKDLPFPIIDKTGSCCSGIRGVEIYSWIGKNVDHKIRDDREQFRYAILDDDSDMLLWQKDHFFQTSFESGLTEKISAMVIAHLNG